MNKLDLSIIIVNYKTWDYLENCLKSFVDYSPSASYEIIVIDNDSQDGRFEVFQQLHPEIILQKNKGNFGFSHGCNLGAAQAKGESLLFLNPDTELTEDTAIDTMLNYLGSNPDIGIVSCRNVTSDGIGKEIRFLSPWLLFGFMRIIYRIVYTKEINKQYPENRDVWFPDWVTGSVVLIKKELFNKIGKWNEKRYWMYSEDPDLCFKVKMQGKKVALLKHVTIKHAEGGASEPDSNSAVRYKTEDTISKHNYIQENSNGLARIVLHGLYFLKVQTYTIAIALNLLSFRREKSKIKVLVLIKCWKYYLQAIKKRSWKNSRLEGI